MINEDLNDAYDSIDAEKNLHQLIHNKAIELFQICDIEEKGFIVKKDIQRIQTCVGLTSDELEDVFDSLDPNNNGYITLNEFINGFNNYHGVATKTDNKSSNLVNVGQEIYEETIASLGADCLTENEDHIKTIWLFLHENNQSMQKAFETLLESSCTEIRRSKLEIRAMDTALHKKSINYDEEMRKLYEEMESQIKIEKNKLIAQEKLKEREYRDRIEREINEKDRQIQEYANKQTELESKIFKLTLIQSNQKQEIEKILTEKEDLEERLQVVLTDLKDSKVYITKLQEKNRLEKKNRAKQALKQTEDVVLERVSLVRELEILRQTVKFLQDERDELRIQKDTHNTSLQSYESDGYPRLMKQGSILSKYYEENSSSLEVDDSVLDSLSSEGAIARLSKIEHANGTYSYADILNVPPNASPDRVFKIIFIGDSGVGKTSFIERFCNNLFKDSFNTTIGVDFQVKLLKIENQIIALQLWDTAGQERFRSLTKQYFRKSDGVICMYDVTSEQSYKSVRNWLCSVKEMSEEDCLITIIGNKTDLCEEDDNRVVKYKDGECLAKEYDALFYESSSKQNKNVIEAMTAIGRILREKEDKNMEDLLNLRVKEKKKGCCN